MANGASRLSLSRVALQGNSKKDLYKAFNEENETAKSVKKIPLKNPTKNNKSR